MCVLGDEERQEHFVFMFINSLINEKIPRLKFERHHGLKSPTTELAA